MDSTPRSSLTRSERKMTGTIFRGYVTALAATGLSARVYARVGPEVKQLIDRPPFPTRWVQTSLLEDFLVAVESVGGLASVRQLAYEAVDISVGPIIAPIIRGFLAIFGNSPATIFSRMDKIAATTTRGYTFAFTPRSSNSGVVEVDAGERASHAFFTSWEGAFRHAYVLTGVAGTVAPCTLKNASAAADYEVEWEAK